MMRMPILSMINNMNNLYKRQSHLFMQLSTGQRIVSAADDPAGLAISEKMRSQIRGLRQAQRNVLDGISLIQTAEAGMNEIHNMLQRMRELSVQSANGTLRDEDREMLNMEFQELKEGIGDIASNTEYNTIPLLDGSKEIHGLNLQVGPNAGDQQILKIGSMTAIDLGIDTLDISTQAGAENAMDQLSNSIKNVSLKRGLLGAGQNRLEHTLNSLRNYEENLTAAESRIRDLDMAKAILEFTKNQILLQVSQALIAQSMRMERERVLKLFESL